MTYKYEHLPLRFDRPGAMIESRPPAGFTVTCRKCGRIETAPKTRNQKYCNAHRANLERGR